MKPEHLRWILRFVGIASLWPFILGWEHPGWRYVAYVILAVLFLDTVGLVKGVRKSADEAKKKRPRL